MQVNLTEKVKKRLIYIYLLFLIPFRFRKCICLKLVSRKNRYKTSNSARRKRKYFLTSFTSDRGPIFSRSSVGHLWNKFILPFWSVENHIYNWDTSLNWERENGKRSFQMILSFDTWQERPPRKDFFFSRKPKIGPKCQAKCDKSNLLDIMDKAACFSGNMTWLTLDF